MKRTEKHRHKKISSRGILSVKLRPLLMHIVLELQQISTRCQGTRETQEIFSKKKYLRNIGGQS